MQTAILSRIDRAAMKAIADYRRSIGLDSEATMTPALLEAKLAETAKRQAFHDIGAFVDGLRRWDLFVTATFRPIVRREANPRGLAKVELGLKHYAPLPLFREQQKNLTDLRARDFELRRISRSPSEGFVRRFFTNFRLKLQRELGTPVSYFTGFEASPLSGQNHFHALLGARGLEDVSRKELWQWLFDNAGRSLILPFERDRGAGWYLGLAYVGKRPLGWDFHVHGRSRLTRDSASGGGHDVATSAVMPRPFFHATLGRWHR